MDEVRDSSIDVAVTSPPYNRNKWYGEGGKVYKDNLRMINYLRFLSKVFTEVRCKLRDSGLFFLNIGDSTKDIGKSRLVLREAEKVGFKHVSTIIWIKSLLGKGHYTPIKSSKHLARVWEYIFVLAKGDDYTIYPKEIGIPYTDKRNISRWEGNIDLRDAGDVWFIPYDRTLSKTVKGYSPCPFPVELPMRCIKLTKANSVLDPFAGSGTTMLAADHLNIRGIGYEAYPVVENIYANLERVVETEPVILIPHLIEAVKLLSDNYNMILDKNTKKFNNKLSIVNNVLRSLDVDEY